MLTNWGYEVEDKIPPIIDESQFDRLTGGVMSATTEQKAAMLESVSAAIRDYCGWHVGPALDCSYIGQGEGRLLLLPAMNVTSIKSLEINGASVDFEYQTHGMVRLKSGTFPDSWQSVRCVYKAGYTVETLGEIVAQITSNALVAAPGIAEEHAGSVGATYNRTGDGITGGVSILPRDLALLTPYKLVRAW